MVYPHIKSHYKTLHSGSISLQAYSTLLICLWNTIINKNNLETDNALADAVDIPILTVNVCLKEISVDNI